MNAYYNTNLSYSPALLGERKNKLTRESLEKMGDIGGKCFPLGWSVVAKTCDACKTAASVLFCRTDSTYMCMACDAKLHGASKHERVWLCEVCEQAPASVTCKADAAALCVTCDRDIHSANPLARRHERIQVVPFYKTAVSIVKSTATAFLEVPSAPAADESSPIIFGYQESKKNTCVAPEEHNSSWLPPINNINSKISAEIEADIKSIELLFSEEDNLLGFDYPVPIIDPRPLYNSGADSVVPAPKPLPPPPAVLMDQSADNHFEIDFTSSNMSSFNTSYTAQSNDRNLQVSSSTMDFGVVPDGSSVSDMSYPFALQMNSSSIDLSGSTNGSGQASQLMGFDREARVMRYREKRKNRKFEKTIRYASRKAYAERRPRIKGRFAKRIENIDQPELDRWFKSGATTTTFMGDSSKFGVVPSFE